LQTPYKDMLFTVLQVIGVYFAKFLTILHSMVA
jgi:hypothetical protein